MTKSLAIPSLRAIRASRGEGTSVLHERPSSVPRLLRLSLRSMARNEGVGRSLFRRVLASLFLVPSSLFPEARLGRWGS